ncbi:MAG: M20/M25/M40 family metallo-hydrolase [Candidatus Aminicenantes bacterium]|nr:M20/M25/M40 family metallo-hydrolase [Candidatus Aminicenantes bacterium]
MKSIRPSAGVFAVLCLSVSMSLAGVHPDIQKVIQSVSAERVEELLKTFESFQTRNLLSSDTAGFGIKASAEWIKAEFEKANPDLNVYLDRFILPKQGRRLTRDVELINVVAVLPGKWAGGNKERIFLVNAHYDTISRSADGRFHSDESDTPAPGINDDASGVAAMIEAARAFRGLAFEATVYFVAFAGEEMGLIGSTLMAAKLKEQGKNIEGVFTLDMIGNIKGGGGRIDNNRMRIFSAGPADSPSRQLARYAKRFGEEAFPAVEIDCIFRADRFGRGGDHTPFVLEGYPGIRLMEASENYAVQHSPDDTLNNMDLDYCTQNIRIISSILATLALAPPAPEVSGERGRSLLGRGDSGYDAHLRWQGVEAEDLSGYFVHWRKTTAPFWEKKVFVKDAPELLLPGVSIDEFVFGVSAVDRDGFESPVAAYTMPPRTKQEYITKK